MMWASQLRDYRQETDKKSRISSRKGTAASDGSLQRSQAEGEVAGGGGVPHQEEGVKQDKTLNKCAQLLTEMMHAEPGLLRQSADQRASKILASKLKKNKSVKPNVPSKNRKVCERISKATAAKKPALKVGGRGKNREHAVDSISETSTELQVRLNGPQPMPLNNSETVMQVTGVRPITGPQVQPGQVLMTNVPLPYNERILSSTPMSSPAANRHRPTYSMHSDQSGASSKVDNSYKQNVQNPSVYRNQGGVSFPTHSQSFTQPANTAPPLSHPQQHTNPYPGSQPHQTVHPDSLAQHQNMGNPFTGSQYPMNAPVYPSTEPAYPLDQGTHPATSRSYPQMAPGVSTHTSQDHVAPASNVVDAMKRYVTQSDEYLTSFIQSCLAQGNIPIPGSAANAQLGQSHGNVGQMSQGQMSHSQKSQGQMSHGQKSQGQMSQGQISHCQMSQGQANQGQMSHSQMSHGHVSHGQMSQSQMSQGQMSQSQMSQGYVAAGNQGQMGSLGTGLTQPGYTQQWTGSATNMSSNLQQGLGQQPQLATDVDIDAILRSHGIQLNQNGQPVEGLKTQPSDWPTSTAGLGYTTDTGKENQPPHFTADTQEKAEKHVVLDKETYEDTNPIEPHQETKQKSKKSPTKSSSKKEKEKTKKKTTENPTRTASVEKPSPADMKTQVRTLLYLFGELRAVTSISRDREAERLLKEMQQMLEQLTPGLSTSGLSTDMDLALQPLRSENAQLRRRIRILTQQFKDKCHAVDEATKPDPNFQVIHLELQRHSLEKQLEEEAAEKEKLQKAIATLAQQVQGLMKERQNMIKLLGAKDSDNLKSQQDWISEASSLRAQLKSAETLRRETETRLEEADQEKVMLEVSLKQKTKETDRLRDLVKSLQGSMSNLLEDLRGNKSRSLPAVDDISRYIENIGTLLRTEKPHDVLLDTKPSKEEPTPTNRPSATTSGIFSSLLDQATPFGRPLHDLIRAVPDPTQDSLGADVEHGLQRAYRLLDRIDDAMVPANLRQPGVAPDGPPQDHSKAKPTKESKRSRPKERATGGSPQRKKDHQKVRQEKERVRRVSPTSQPVQHGFDPAHDNYQGQLTQELLLEHDRQNGVDEEVIERMLIRSTHSPRRTEGQQEQGRSTVKQKAKPDMGIQRKPQYSGFKGSEEVQSSLEEPEIRISLDKLPAVTVTDSDNDKRSGFSSLQSPFDMDTTEYLNPPQNLKGQQQESRQEQQSVQKPKADFSTGVTVKDLLAPLADRIMYSPASKRVLTYNQDGISPASSNLTDGSLSSETDLEGGEGETDGEGDSTLVEEQGGKGFTGKTNLSVDDPDESRYSVSDYFKKYQAGSSLRTPITSQPKSSQGQVPLQKPITSDVSRGSQMGNQSHPDASKLSIQTANDITGQSTSFTTVTSASSNSKPVQLGTNQRSPQDRLYRGTELDTSLSTIQEAESNSVLSASTVTSVSSLATVDEQDFKDGLAKLDENIARIQYSLKTQIGGYIK